ncbi:protein neprosin isoform X2 [Rhododendron vialii]|uniref:protein neprosin isoform X2 n=1 Tax=Rhododendron vialii TaxID=182163 RepID=UPI00265E0A7B|nr:protein neprosin isoform X2 [Rhododendron vialii]
MGITVIKRKRGVSTLHLLLLLLHFLSSSAIFSGKLVVGLNYTKHTRRVGSLRLSRIQRHLEKINKPPVFTIESPDGDVIDCVHKRKQPALDHPLLKNHKIQGERCPKGTVPIRRSTVDDVLRAKSLYDFGKKQVKTPLIKNGGGRQINAPDVVSGNGHEHAIAYTGASQEVYGAKATINVWDPSIEEVNEFSLSQIWVLSGSFDGSDLNSIEAGWQVSPELYGDSRPRLFTYWTSDSYQATGCYNLLCSGFIQTNSKIAIGAAISPVSSLSGSQFDITILIWKDPKLGNWWMSFGESTLVGYWPAELFTHLDDGATMVEWGGEVVNSRANNRHTTTQMGSGQFAEQGFGKASYFRNLEVVDSDNSLTSAKGISTLAENVNCYDIKSFSNGAWGTYFYYGGPGYNPKCP